MEKIFTIEKLSNYYGTVSGEEIEGKYYLLLEYYIGCTKVEISELAFNELYNQFGKKRCVNS